MEEFLQMNIFFFIASLFSVIFGVLIALILIKVLRILKTVEHISDDVSEETRALKGDVQDLRRKVRSEGLKIGHIAGMFGSVIKRLKK